jgi:type VI protein secretion system component Hcp
VISATRQASEFEKVRLSDVLVSSYQADGEVQNERPEDGFSLNFVKIDFLCTVLKTGETVETTFDFSAFTGG